MIATNHEHRNEQTYRADFHVRGKMTFSFFVPFFFWNKKSQMTCVEKEREKRANRTGMQRYQIKSVYHYDQTTHPIKKKCLSFVIPTCPAACLTYCTF